VQAVAERLEREQEHDYLVSERLMKQLVRRLKLAV